MMLSSVGIVAAGVVGLRLNVGFLVILIAMVTTGIAIQVMLHGDSFGSAFSAVISVDIAFQAGYLSGVVAGMLFMPQHRELPRAHPRGSWPLTTLVER